MMIQRHVYMSGVEEGVAIAGVVATLASTATGVRESQLSRKAAEEANVPIAPLPQTPAGALQSTTNQVQQANQQAASAGASLLSGPPQQGGQRQIGTAPAGGRSLLGT